MASSGDSITGMIDVCPRIGTLGEATIGKEIQNTLIVINIHTYSSSNLLSCI